MLACVAMPLLCGLCAAAAQCLPLACIICEQGPDAQTLEKWAAQKHKLTQIVDAGYKPLAGVKVTLQNGAAPLQQSAMLTTSTYTSGPGLFSYRADSESTQLLVFSKPGYASIAHRVAETLPRQIVLPAEKVLTGTVTRANGAPIENARIGPLELFDPAEDHGSSDVHPVYPFLLAQTDKDGHFEMRQLQDAKYRLTVRAAGLASASMKVRPGEEIKIILSDDITSVAGKLSGSRDSISMPAKLVEARSGELREFARTDPDGNFLLNDLAPQKWTFRAVSAAGDLPNPLIERDLARHSAESLQLSFNQGISVSGVAVDANTSQPVKALSLIIETPFIQRAQTDEEGRFRFNGLDGTGDISLRFDGRHFAAFDEEGLTDRLRIPADPYRDITTVALVLARRATLQGVVTNSQLQRIPSVTVLLNSAESSGSKSQQTETGADGSFTFNVYPAGRYQLSAVASQGFAPPQVVDLVTSFPATATLQLKPYMQLTGIVTSADGTPVSSATVEARFASSTFAETDFTDEHGTFHFARVPAGGLELCATHREFAQKALRLISYNAEQSSGIVVLSFPPGDTLIAEVVDSNGAPVENADLSMTHSSSDDLPISHCRTNNVGVAKLNTLPPIGNVSFQVSHPSFVTTELSKVQRNTTNVVQLARRPGIQLIAALPHGDAEASCTGLLYRRLQVGEFNLNSQSELTSGKGEFANLEPGFYKAAAKRGDSYSESAVFELSPGEHKEISIVLDSKTIINGAVVDARTEAPIAGAIVTMEPVLNRAAQMEPVRTSSDKNGQFVVSCPSGGMMQLSVMHASYPQLVRRFEIAAESPQTLKIELSSSVARVRGKTTFAGNPIADSLLVLCSAQDPETPYMSTMSNRDGTFEISGITPGDYSLNVEAPLTDDDALGHRCYSLNLQKDADEFLAVSFVRPVQVRGKIDSASADNVRPDEPVFFRPKFKGGMTQSRKTANGSFTIEMEPGDYVVSVADSPGNAVTIPANYDRPFQLELRQ